MTTDTIVASGEYLDRLKNSLTVSAVLKAELGAVKSSCGSANVFAYEGHDDKIIYSHWISKVRPDISYEPFVCRNKDQLLLLWNSLKSDLTGMKENVYFFADRDFDDLKKYTSDKSIFLTEMYSVENYLVQENVLDEILKIDFHCHGNINDRKNIIDLFLNDYNDFLNVTSNLNFRIYLARQCGIEQIGDHGVPLNDLAEIKIGSIARGKGEIGRMVCLVREPSDAEVAAFQNDFASLERKARYRGKFALQFFRKWLQLLLVDRNSEGSALFRNVNQNNFVAKGEFSFNHLASKSRPSDCFCQFVARIEH